jgi:8-oxo-dGTP diphosphatase
MKYPREIVAKQRDDGASARVVRTARPRSRVSVRGGRQQAGGPVASPRVAVDVVIFTIDGGELKALLVQVNNGRFIGRWAFPGGIVPVGEAPEVAATRELRAQTGIEDVYLEQLRTFGDPGRDPQAHVVSIAYFALAPSPAEMSPISDKYAGVKWASVKSLPRLAYDHNHVADYALARLRAKLAYTNVAFSLLPEAFSLGELQEVYEIILDRKLDRRNFRKKIVALGLLRAIGRQRRGPHRPAHLYRFRRRALMNVQIL